MDSPPDEIVQRARELVSNVELQWNSITGTLYTWYNEDLLDIGRARFNGQESTEAEGTRSSEPRSYINRHINRSRQLHPTGVRRSLCLRLVRRRPRW